MPAPAGGARRASALLVALLALFVLAPWGIFLLAPLAGLLAVSRPASVRAIAWLAVSVAASAAWAASNGDLLGQVLSAWAVLIAGAFAILALSARWRVLTKAMVAIAMGTAALAALGLALDLPGWRTIELMFARQLAADFAAMTERFAAMGEGGQPAAEVAGQMQAQSRWLAATMPGTLVLTMLAGLGLAWRWHEVVADKPVGPAARPFAEFTFGDRWVWVVIAALAVVLAVPLTQPGIAAANVLLVALGLYALRGVAIANWFARHLPRPIAVTVVVAAILLAGFTVSGLTLLGLADVWLNFRRDAPLSHTRIDE